MRISLTLLLALALAANAQDQKKKKSVAGDDINGYTDTPMIPGQPWKVHDAARPRPAKVTPGRPAVSMPAPADADILFNGKDLSKWQMRSRAGELSPPTWKVENGYFEIVPAEGMRREMITKEKYGDCQLHLEWQIPLEEMGKGQAGGNSGVEFMGRRYEIQVMESLVNQTYADGQAAAIYGQYPPTVNASAAKGDWNTYDILFTAPRFDGEKLLKPAYVTVIHNGVVVHNHREILGPVAHRRALPYKAHPPEDFFSLQDHGHNVRYRNIWIRRLKDGQ